MTPCRNCGSAGLASVLSLGEQPLANAYLDQESLERPEATYPLALAHCPECSLVQLTHTVSPESVFRDYPYFSSVSDAFVEHARSLVSRVIDERRLDGSSMVVEIGSNDGYLLRHYTERGIPVLGIDPAANVAAIAIHNGVPTVAEFFTKNLADELHAAGRDADVIHANNVIAHVPDLHGTIEGIVTILKPNGVVIIETPYVRDLVERVEFDTIYHEHVFYYSLLSLSRVLERHGLRVVDVEQISVHGGSLRVIATHAANAAEPAARVSTTLGDEAAIGLATADYYRDFASRVDTVRAGLRTILQEIKAAGMSVAAYGAAAKGTVLLNAFDIGTETLDFVADRSPSKQGLFMPGKHVPIVAAEELHARAPDVCLLLAWNFADEILAQQMSYTSGGGRFIVPAPQVRYLD